MSDFSLFKSDSRLRWFIGEILVIVIGVLLALALDGFWTELQERELEIDYLRRVQSDLNADIGYANNVINNRLEIKILALETIAPVVRGRDPVPDDLEAFLTNVSLGGVLGASSSEWITDTTFEDLKSTGNLRLIGDTALRQKISDYYNQQARTFQRARDRQTRYVETVHSVFPAELRDELTIEAMSEFGTQRAVERFLSSDFEDLLNQELNYAYFMRNQNRAAPAYELLNELNAYISFAE